MVGDTGSKLLFRTGGPEIDVAVEQSIDDAANERGTVHHVAGRLSDVAGEAIESHDLSIEQHDRHSGPRLGVDEWTSTSRVSTTERLPGDALRNHRERV
jgi:hypothetical protein